MTIRAVKRFQRRKNLVVDGVAGPQTVRALGRYGRHRLGDRVLYAAMRGWDVAELQFRLAWHGFPSGPFDGIYGNRTEAALKRFQRWAGLAPDGLLGPATVRALAAPIPRSPITLSPPLAIPYTDTYGPRGNRFHTGLDYPAPTGTPVAAAGAGRVTYAAWHPGGWGYLVSIAHRSGVRTQYAHLSRIDVKLGQVVAAGTRIGLVGSTGHSTGAHLHFEVRLRGAPIDPLTALR